MSIVTAIYKKTLIHRYDDDHIIHYFSPDDYKNLRAESYKFKSGNNTLQGYFFYYDNVKEDSLIVFCHGIGGGFRSYMTEIELLCKKGFKVFSYDLTGCFESSGESIRGCTQFLADLDAAINSLKRKKIFQSYKKVYIIGHSWGGYAAANILNYHKDIAKVVSISAPLSIEIFFDSYFTGFGKLFKNSIIRYEKKQNPKYFKSCAINALKNTSTPSLIVQSTDDNLVPFDSNTGLLRKEIDNQKVQFLICSDKKHNPNYGLDAVNYYNEVFSDYNTKIKKKKLRTFEEKNEYHKNTDWKRMTKQDLKFWNQVISFLEK